MFGERKYAANYGGSHPGDHGVFAVVITVILVLAGICYTWM